MDAAKQLGFGPVVKTVLQFKTRFWSESSNTRDENLSQFGFLFSQLKIPTWWSQYPDKNPVLTGWSAGRHATALEGLSEEKIMKAALTSLSEIFGVAVSFLEEQLEGWQVANWLNDPYSNGGYSYEVVNGATFKKILKSPLEERIFFAGEGLFEGPEIGTVNAALVLGRDTAQQMVATFKK
jgi:monoamine oxidase